MNASIADLLTASNDWGKVLDYAANPGVEIIISNTTESGLQLDDQDDCENAVPISFPAKLLAVLWHRFNIAQGDANAGFVILPTELVPGNGAVLKALVMQLTDKFNCSVAFKSWINEANDFCNTLVDRIVPGKLPTEAHTAKEIELGYKDPLMIMSEPYGLWAIETDSNVVTGKLSFAGINEGVVLAPSIKWYVEQKLRLLNGTHTFITGLAILSGFTTVKEAMANEDFNAFVKKLMKEEIVPCIANTEAENKQAIAFANAVLDRFRNPFLEHKWQSIALNYTGKMQLRNLPLLDFWKNKNTVPPCMAVGFAAYLLLQRAEKNDGKLWGSYEEQKWYLDDPFAAQCAAAWKKDTVAESIETLMHNEDLWGSVFSSWPDFVAHTQHAVQAIIDNGALATITACLSIQKQLP